jgi:tetratricopeptide (TPR) repeat protein
LGAHHLKRGRWTDARDAFEQSTRIAPSDPAAWIAYGMAMIASQDLPSARGVRDILVERFPERAETHVIAGHIHKIEGHFAAAADSYRRALGVDPEQLEALFNLGELASPAPTDPLTERLETLMHSSALPRRGAAMGRFALARIYESAGIVDKAFAWYRDANAAATALMASSGNSYDPRRAEAAAAQIIEIFSAEALAHPLPPLDLDMRIIFIVGLPRSGTTLTERILSNHTQVSSGGELPFMQETLAKVRHSLAATRASGAKLDAPEHRRALLQLRNEYIDTLFEAELDGKFVIDKLPANFSALGLIRIMFPDALIVHCRRDPIAACWSLYTTYFDSHLSYNTSLEHLAHYHQSIYVRLMRHWSSIEGMNIISTDYEAIVASPEREIRELLDRCGLPWEDACHKVEGNDRPIFTASATQARRPIYSTSVARWRKFEPHLRPLIESLRDPERS